MFKRLIGASCAIAALAGAASAQAACSSFPYALTNTTTADGSQVMANLNCLLVSPAFTGPVGVGTTAPNPSTTLDVRSPSGAGVPVALFGYGQAGIALEQNWPGLYFNNYYINGANYFMGSGYAGILNLDAQNGDFYIQTSSAAGATGGIVPFNPPALYVKNNGFVGIGTTSPATLLDVTGAAIIGKDANYALYTRLADGSPHPFFAESGGYTDFYDAGGIGYAWRNQADTTTLMYLADGGNLSINGLIAPYGWVGRTGVSGSSANGNVFNFWWTGSTAQLWVDSTNVGTITVSSDRRIKHDIQPLAPDSGIAAIRRLNPVSFYWNDKASGLEQQYGFIAQDVRTVLPNLVRNTGMKTEATPDGLLHLEYNGLFAPIVKAVQELSADSDTEKSEIDKQKAAISELKSEVADLKKMVVALQAAH